MMFGEHSKMQFIEQTRAARIERANDRKRDQSAVLIQSVVRGWLVRKRTRSLILSVHFYIKSTFYLLYLIIVLKYLSFYRQQFDDTFDNINDLKPAINIYLIVKKCLIYWDEKRDRQRFEKLCRY